MKFKDFEKAFLYYKHLYLSYFILTNVDEGYAVEICGGEENLIKIRDYQIVPLPLESEDIKRIAMTTRVATRALLRHFAKNKNINQMLRTLIDQRLMAGLSEEILNDNELRNIYNEARRDKTFLSLLKDHQEPFLSITLDNFKRWELEIEKLVLADGRLDLGKKVTTINFPDADMGERKRLSKIIIIGGVVRTLYPEIDSRISIGVSRNVAGKTELYINGVTKEELADRFRDQTGEQPEVKYSKTEKNVTEIKIKGGKTIRIVDFEAYKAGNHFDGSLVDVTQLNKDEKEKFLLILSRVTNRNLKISEKNGKSIIDVNMLKANEIRDKLPGAGRRRGASEENP